MHMPIYGSIINPPAKLYKRFTPTESVRVDDTVILYENNYYKLFAKIRYIEATEKNGGDTQLLQGLIAPESSVTIKYNGKYRKNPKDPDHGDLAVIDNELWMIDGVQKVRHRMIVDAAVVYLSLRKVL